MDRLSPSRRSWNMAQIRGTNTKPELAVRSALHRLGFRFRLRSYGLPGRPDVVLVRLRVAVFVHGCFWHRHPDCRYASTPSTRPEFWASKFAANVARDNAVRSNLLLDGWRVATIWECAMRSKAGAESAGGVVSEWLHGTDRELDLGEAHLNYFEEQAEALKLADR